MVKVLCNTCGREFQTTPWQSRRNHHFCGRRCYQQWRKTRTGSLNPHWKGGEVIKDCCQCGKSFTVCISIAPTRKYCSMKCKAEASIFKRLCLNCGKPYQGHLRKFCTYKCHLGYRRKNPRHCTPETREKIASSKRDKNGLYGFANPMYKDGLSSLIDKTCPICGELFIAPARRKYCSRKCMAKDGQRRRDIFLDTPKGRVWREMSSKQMSGEGNPRWNDGASRKPYSFDFSPELKARILERDNFTCYTCERSKYLLIHHIDNSKTNSSPDNLITLCRFCHSKLHARKETLPPRS